MACPACRADTANARRRGPSRDASAICEFRRGVGRRGGLRRVRPLAASAGNGDGFHLLPSRFDHVACSNHGVPYSFCRFSFSLLSAPKSCSSLPPQLSLCDSLDGSRSGHVPLSSKCLVGQFLGKCLDASQARSAISSFSLSTNESRAASSPKPRSSPCSKSSTRCFSTQRRGVYTLRRFTLSRHKANQPPTTNEARKPATTHFFHFLAQREECLFFD